MSATIIPVLGNDYQIYAMQEDEDGLNEAADLFDSTDRLELRPIDVAWLLSQLPNTPDDSTAYPWLFSYLLAVLRWRHIGRVRDDLHDAFNDSVSDYLESFGMSVFQRGISRWSMRWPAQSAHERLKVVAVLIRAREEYASEIAKLERHPVAARY